MPEVVRDGDSTTTGSRCEPVTTVTDPWGELKQVYANGIPVVCMGDPTEEYRPGIFPICVLPKITGVINVGSPTVFVGGIPIARVGDSCAGGELITGSHNVFADDG